MQSIRNLAAKALIEFRCDDEYFCAGAGEMLDADYGTSSGARWLANLSQKYTIVDLDNLRNRFDQADLDLGRLLTWSEFTEKFKSAFTSGTEFADAYVGYTDQAKAAGKPAESKEAFTSDFLTAFQTEVDTFAIQHEKAIESGDKWILKVRGPKPVRSCWKPLKRPAEIGVVDCGWQYVYIIQHDRTTGKDNFLGRLASSYSEADGLGGTMGWFTSGESCTTCDALLEGRVYKMLLQDSELPPMQYTTVLGVRKEAGQYIVRRIL